MSTGIINSVHHNEGDSFFFALENTKSQNPEAVNKVSRKQDYLKNLSSYAKCLSVWMWATFFEGGRTSVFLLPLLKSKQSGSAPLKSHSHAQAGVGDGCGQCLSASSLWSCAGSFPWLGPSMGLVESLSLLVSKSLPELALHSYLDKTLSWGALLWVMSWKASSASGMSISNQVNWQFVWQVKIAHTWPEASPYKEETQLSVKHKAGCCCWI